MGKYKLGLAGAFHLVRPDGQEILVSSEKSMALLALLATAPGGSRNRKFLSETLWSSKLVGNTSENLRQELRNLSRLLAEHEADHLLEWFRQPKITLKMEHVDLDIADPVQLRARARDPEIQFMEGLDARNSDALDRWLQRRRSWLRDVLELEASLAEGRSAEAEPGSSPPPPPRTPPAAAPKPAVLVLPFSDVGRRDDIDMSGEDVAYSISAKLSRLPQLKILSSREASVALKRGRSPFETAELFGAQYMLTGSARWHASGCKATAELTDCASGEQFWSRSFEAYFDQTEDIEDVIALSVAPQIWSEVDQAERELRLRTSDLPQTAYDKYWRASALYRRWDRRGVMEAVELTESLLDSDPHCNFSLGLSAFCNAVSCRFGWAQDAEAARTKALERVEAVYRRGRGNAEALGYAAGALLVLDENADLADRLIDCAIELDPDQQPPYFWGGWIDLRRGRTGRARERFELSLALNPASGVRAYAMTGIGLSHILEGDSRLALKQFGPAAELAPEFILTHAGLLIAARAAGEAELAAEAAASIEAVGGAAAVASLLGKERQHLLQAILPEGNAG